MSLEVLDVSRPLTEPDEVDVLKIAYYALLRIFAGTPDCSRVKFFDTSGTLVSVSDPCKSIQIAGEALDLIHELGGAPE